MSDDQDFPDRLWSTLIEDNLPWDKKSDLNIDSFIEKYTLHDSDLAYVFDDAWDKSVTLVFVWDPVWLPDNVKENLSRVNVGPLLFINIDKVDQIWISHFNKYTPIISDMEYQIIDGRKYIAIDVLYGGKVDILFSGNVSFLAIERNGKVLTI
jgi:hypothetical protein